MALNEGMTQKRGEATKDQDKFRVTVEREQRCYGFCDDTREPVFAPGTTSVTLTGSHFRMSNVKWPEETWLHTERFCVNGTEVIHEAGQPLPENLARSVREVRREAPEFWAYLENLALRFISSQLDLMTPSYAPGKLRGKQSQHLAASESLTALEAASAMR